MKSIAFAALLFLAPISATLADDAAAPAATPATMDDSLAPPSCKKPVLPSKLRKADDTSDFQEKVDSYRECIKTYTQVQGALANKHIAAANGAVKDLNDFVNLVNESQNEK
jgi:hypothetical protein